MVNIQHDTVNSPTIFEHFALLQTSDVYIWHKKLAYIKDEGFHTKTRDLL